MKILICGDRNWSNVKLIEETIKNYPELRTIIEGGAPGADAIAREVARTLHIPYIEVRANWRRFGLAAGPKRNKAMLEMKPDLVIAFHNNIIESKGTGNCLCQAEDKNIRYALVSE